MLSLQSFLILLLLTALSHEVNVTSVEQYVAVMRLEEYVPQPANNGTLSSLFIGLIHISVTSFASPPANPNYVLETTVWHQVDFANNISINGPAAAGQLAPSLPLLVLAAGPAVLPTNCPLQGSWTVDAAFMRFLRAGLMYVQIQSSQAAGDLRGNIYSRRDALVAFIGNTPGAFAADQGMAVIQAVQVTGGRASTSQTGSPQRLVYLKYWILTRYTSGTFAFITGGTNYTNAGIFAPIPAGQTTNVTLTITPYVVNPGDEAPVQFFNTIFNSFPFYGPGSSNIVLVLQGVQQFVVFSQFIAMAVWNDYEVLSSNGTNPYTSETSPSHASTITILIPLMLSVILFKNT
jgi:hypothetical protein